MIAAVTAALLAALQNEADERARAAIEKLSVELKDVKTLSAIFTQTRRTPLLDEPMRSAGRLYYRREPEKLVLEFLQPRPSKVHLDAATYEVYRPAEKQLERFELSRGNASRWFLLAFRPTMSEIEKSFRIKGGKAEAGRVEVHLEPIGEELRKTLARVVLVVIEGEHPSLSEFSYLDKDDEEVSFRLEKPELNPEIPEGTFRLTIPSDVRVLKHEAEPARDR